MKSGTRRMWARRVLRTGWLIAPLFALPRKVFGLPRRFYQYFLTDYDGKFSVVNLFLTLMVTGFFSAIVALFGSEIYKSQTASPEHIADAMKADTCMLDYIPRLAANQNSPLTNGDVSAARDTCDKTYKEFYEMKAQKETIEAIGGKK